LRRDITTLPSRVVTCGVGCGLLAFFRLNLRHACPHFSKESLRDFTIKPVVRSAPKDVPEFVFVDHHRSTTVPSIFFLNLLFRLQANWLGFLMPKCFDLLR